MESLHILRDHLENHKTSFTPDIEAFSTILDGIEKRFSADLTQGNNKVNYDQYISQCIDLEGRNVIGANR